MNSPGADPEILERVGYVYAYVEDRQTTGCQNSNKELPVFFLFYRFKGGCTSVFLPKNRFLDFNSF